MDTARQPVQYRGCLIIPASEEVHADTPAGATGWRPAAIVRIDEGEGFTERRIEPAHILIVYTKSEADQIAIQQARTWIDQASGIASHDITRGTPANERSEN